MKPEALKDKLSTSVPLCPPSSLQSACPLAPLSVESVKIRSQRQRTGNYAGNALLAVLSIVTCFTCPSINIHAKSSDAFAKDFHMTSVCGRRTDLAVRSAFSGYVESLTSVSCAVFSVTSTTVSALLSYASSRTDRSSVSVESLANDDEVPRLQLQVISLLARPFGTVVVPPDCTLTGTGERTSRSRRSQWSRVNGRCAATRRHGGWLEGR